MIPTLRRGLQHPVETSSVNKRACHDWLREEINMARAAQQFRLVSKPGENLRSYECSANHGT